MSRGRQASIEQERVIKLLVAEGFGGTQIYRELESRDLLTDPHPGLHKRTVQRMVQELKQADSSGPWSFIQADPNEASLVLEVLLDTYDWTQGRVWLTKNLAERVVRIRKASPAVPIAWAYVFSLEYLHLGEDEDSRYLDLLLAARPWEEDRWTFEQWMHFVDMSPSPEKVLSLLYLGAYEIDQDDVHRRLRWLPPYHPWMTTPRSELARFFVSGPPGQRERAWLPRDPATLEWTASGQLLTSLVPDSKLTAEPAENGGHKETASAE